MLHAPVLSFEAEIFPDFIALVMVAMFLPVAFAASPAVYCITPCVPLHCLLLQVLRCKGFNPSPLLGLWLADQAPCHSRMAAMVEEGRHQKAAVPHHGIS